MPTISYYQDLIPMPQVPLGRPIREKFFEFAPGYINLNHGSFGAAPKPVTEAQFNSVRHKNLRPDQYMRFDAYDNMIKARELVAGVLDAEVSNLVLVANVTTAINTIFRSYPFEKGDKIIRLATAYPACYNTLDFLREKHGIEIVDIDPYYPGSHESVIRKFKDAIDSNPGIKMALFDAVSSLPSTLYPWEQLIQICREKNILSVVDGAHVIGLLPVSLRKARPDFFTTNLHKWFYVNHSVAALYVDKAHHAKINSLPVSVHYQPANNNTFSKEDQENVLAKTFAYIGTSDRSVIESVPAAVEFWNKELGGYDNALAFQRKTARATVDMWEKEFDTEEIKSFHDESERFGLVTFLFPIQGKTEEENQKIMDFIHNYYFTEGTTYVPLWPYKGILYIRFSTPSYVDEQDVAHGIKITRDAIEAYKAQV